jgi:imidazole glycerol-phosphate synthase subunit HisF
MLQKRIIPVLQLIDESLVKAVQFGSYSYIGDPCNTVRIFNELEVDELCFLDIKASLENRQPNIEILQDIANECFMPLSYGGGISTFEQAQKIFEIGFEKIILNTQASKNPKLVEQISNHYGAQAVVIGIDAKKMAKGYDVFIKDGTEKVSSDIIAYCKKMESLGAGELLVTSIDREGTWQGLDKELINLVTANTSIPVIAHGGGGTVTQVQDVMQNTNASAVALGSMLVFQKQNFGVLVNYPFADR